MPERINTKDIFALLDYIVNEKAGVFIVERKLDLLYSWISGYKIASNSEQSFLNLDGLHDFSIFVKKKYQEENENSMGWFGSIRAQHGGGQEGFEQFCALYREFRSTNY